MITTRVTSPFGFESTAAEVIAGIDLHGRRALVTGAASGIGVETARALASAGAETVIAARDLAAAERTAAGIRATTGNPADKPVAGQPQRRRPDRRSGRVPVPTLRPKHPQTS
jgi:short chain dehydrogenase